MTNKKIASEIAIGIILLLAVLIGSLAYLQNRAVVKSLTNQQKGDVAQNKIEDNLISPPDSNNPDVSEKNDTLLIQDLCKDEGVVNKCGQYYEKYPPLDVVDASIKIYDQNRKLIGHCGGMPGPDGLTDSPICSTPCQKDDICKLK